MFLQLIRVQPPLHGKYIYLHTATSPSKKACYGRSASLTTTVNPQYTTDYPSVHTSPGTQSSKMITPISPPFAIDKKAKRYGCYIDIDAVPHQASWTGDWGVFDFTDTSRLLGFQLVPLHLTTEIFEVWKSSELLPLAFGSHASARLGRNDSHPILKIAHPNTESRHLIAREFNLMRDLSHLDSVAQVADQPLKDENGFFGFRLELLQRVELEDLQIWFAEVESLVDSLRAAGWCHGDCSPGKIMRKREGKLVLIDLAFAGRLGSEVPEGCSRRMFPGGVWTVDVDRERIEKCGRHGR